MEDKQFLQWIMDRMINNHGENKDTDYMLRFKGIIDSYPTGVDREVMQVFKDYGRIEAVKKARELLKCNLRAAIDFCKRLNIA